MCEERELRRVPQPEHGKATIACDEAVGDGSSGEAAPVGEARLMR